MIPAADAAGLAGSILQKIWEDYRTEFFYALVAVVTAVVRASGRTVLSGNTGLRFSFGRAGMEVGPGFHLLLPFLQVIRTLPTRSRTIDLPEQRVTTLDGLVYEVDANLVYRVVDVRKALIEIDELERGMLQVLGLSVQEVLRGRSRGELYASEALDRELSQRMAERLTIWGVEVERAGFQTIHPSRETTRVTQLAALGAERVQALRSFEAAGVDTATGIALLGRTGRILTRRRLLAERAHLERRVKHKAALERRLDREEQDEKGDKAKARRNFFQRQAQRKLERRAQRAKEGSLVG